MRVQFKDFSKYFISPVYVWFGYMFGVNLVKISCSVVKFNGYNIHIKNTLFEFGVPQNEYFTENSKWIFVTNYTFLHRSILCEKVKNVLSYKWMLRS